MNKYCDYVYGHIAPAESTSKIIIIHYSFNKLYYGILRNNI